MKMRSSTSSTAAAATSLNCTSNGAEITFSKPIEKHNNDEMKALCLKHGIDPHKRDAEGNYLYTKRPAHKKFETKQVLVDRCLMNTRLALHNDGLKASIVTPRMARELEKRRQEDLLVDMDQNRDDPHTVVIITITRSGGKHVDPVIFESYCDFIGAVCYDGVASIEFAGNGKLSPHRHVQSVVTLKVREESDKVRKILSQRIKEYCNIPDDITVSCLWLNRNNTSKGNQTKELMWGYCLKEYSRPGWKG